MSGKNNIPLLVITMAVIFSLLTIMRYYGDRSDAGEGNLVPMTIIALIIGTAFEYWRISGSVRNVLYTTLAALLMSMFSFFPGKSEHVYQIDNHLQMWPFVFLGIFVLIAAAFHPKETVANLTEGVTLLLSLSLIYLLITSGSWWTEGLSLYLVGPPIGIFTLITFIHAFTYGQLTATHRMVMSIWSTIIMVILALVNISELRSIDTADVTVNTGDKIAALLQYFLLGVSAIYLMQNILMLIGFLPGRGTFFNKKYFREYAELKERHIDRYSERQVHPLQSLLAAIFCVFIFGINYYYNIVPPVTAIWFVLLVFPIVIRAIFR